MSSSIHNVRRPVAKGFVATTVMLSMLLAATGGDRARVAIVPTASWPDGEAVFLRWAAQGEAHFAALGADPIPVLVRDRATADDPASVAAIRSAWLSVEQPTECIWLVRGDPARP